jgi:hypothetical protein
MYHSSSHPRLFELHASNLALAARLRTLCLAERPIVAGGVAKVHPCGVEGARGDLPQPLVKVVNPSLGVLVPYRIGPVRAACRERLELRVHRDVVDGKRPDFVSRRVAVTLHGE